MRDKWAGDRCSYCLCSQEYVYSTLHFEHIIPVDKEGSNEENNLCLSCTWCNLSKGVHVDGADPETNACVRLFNPRIDVWSEHFIWGKDKVTLLGKTAIGRATCIVLNMNREIALKVRQNWVAAGWHPPDV
ncbi:MAG: HNH endonuclease [Anaerolineae bacterium]|nr:HNH endonuclease [Gloeobacterales cyanobacterium ES-bin-313]